MKKLLAVLLLCGALSSCGGSSGLRPLTSDQAELLSKVLHNNYTAGGVQFRVSTVSGVSGGTISMDGALDFTKHVGGARITGGAEPYPVVMAFWNENAVLEGRQGLSRQLASLGFKSQHYVARPVDKEHRRLDQIIEVLLSLASKTPENAQLMRQKPDSGFLRHDTLRDARIDVYQFGKQLLLWVDPVKGTLTRLEAYNSTHTIPTIVDVITNKKIQIPGPLASDVVDYTKLGSHFLEWAPQSP